MWCYIMKYNEILLLLLGVFTGTYVSYQNQTKLIKIVYV